MIFICNWKIWQKDFRYIQRINGEESSIKTSSGGFCTGTWNYSVTKIREKRERLFSRCIWTNKNYSSNPIEDQIRLWDLCIFNYLIGNTDNHVKNIALLYSEDLKGIRLAPAYDLLSTVIYDSSTEKMSLNIDGEYDIRNINQKSFENEAKKLGLGKGIATQHF